LWIVLVLQLILKGTFIVVFSNVLLLKKFWGGLLVCSFKYKMKVVQSTLLQQPFYLILRPQIYRQAAWHRHFYYRWTLSLCESGNRFLVPCPPNLPKLGAMAPYPRSDYATVRKNWILLSLPPYIIFCLLLYVQLTLFSHVHVSTDRHSNVLSFLWVI